MAYDTRINITAARNMLDEVAALLDTGTGAIINIYDDTGTVPVDCTADNNTNVLLGTLLCTTPNTFTGAAADAAPNATLTADTITSDSDADFGGTATYFRAYATTGTQTDAGKGSEPIVQGTVGTGGSFDMVLDNTTIVINGTIACTSWVMTLPEGA